MTELSSDSQQETIILILGCFWSPFTVVQQSGASLEAKLKLDLIYIQYQLIINFLRLQAKFIQGQRTSLKFQIIFEPLVNNTPVTDIASINFLNHRQLFQSKKLQSPRRIISTYHKKQKIWDLLIQMGRFDHSIKNGLGSTQSWEEIKTVYLPSLIFNIPNSTIRIHHGARRASGKFDYYECRFKPHNHIMIKSALGSLLLVFLMSSAFALSSFGMNKPHLLFHLGQRSAVSVNYGLGYWLNNAHSDNKQHFTKSRLWYENTNNGLYVNMVSHDGDRHIHQKIEDQTFDVQTEIKYQLRDTAWEEGIEMKQVNTQTGRYRNHSLYWMAYMTVENNDPKLIDHKEYSTSVQFAVTNQQSKRIQVDIDRFQGESEHITVQSDTEMRVFGFSMNTSESYDARGFMEEVKHLIELDKYRGVKRKNDTNLVEWENNQLRLLKRNEWTEGKYVVLVFYGEFTNSNKVFITNGTSPSFNEQAFTEKSKHLNATYFPAQKYPTHSDFLRHILFNLHGGTAFYYGVLYTQNSLLKHELDYSFTFTPSRLIFPRGFLWDDGFHLSVAVTHHPRKVIDVLRNWMRKIDLFGWIGREQIRGFQISSMMPEVKFVYQDIFQMNPPTLILPLLKLIEMKKQGKLSEEEGWALDSLLQDNFWRLEKWYRYFVKTQSHNNLMQAEAVNRSLKYRWRCKDDCDRGNFMGSGLDDYPRTATESQISKQHVDLMSWIYFFSEGLEKIAEQLSLDRPQRYYSARKEEVRRKIMEECLDPVDLLFKDQSVTAKNQYVNELVTKVGYINLFPFFTGVLREELYTPEQRKTVQAVLAKLVTIIGDSEQLLSQGGIRSLSLGDGEYGTLDNYWRGSVWLPINYMVLRACRLYHWDHEGIREVYGRVRQKLVDSVFQNWKESGYLFQNYREGKGNRGFPFYGWTSLIVNIITEQY